jgi:hypothetical protein
MKTQPLAPDPEWIYTQGAGYHSPHATPARSVQSPTDYAAGFEDGAYALAMRLWDDLQHDRMSDLFDTLATYRRGNAHPVQGWQHEPKRS